MSTYIASGNLICRPPGDPAAFDAALQAAITERFGFVREAISRTAAQLLAALDAHPFAVLNPKFSYVSLCHSAPEPDAVAAARRLDTGEDRWRVIGADLHIRYADGAGHA